MADKSKTIGILGGTGPAGKGFALRLAEAGYSTVIGSRSAERGEEIVAELLAKRIMTICLRDDLSVSKTCCRRRHSRLPSEADESHGGAFLGSEILDI